jgi:hypothetical protein
MEKKKRSCVFALIGLFVLVFSFAWYLGLIPVGNGGPKAGLRHALNLKILPCSLEILGSGGESWTDYLFVADIRVSPNQFPELLKGRNFEPYEHYQEMIEESWIQNFEPPHVTESWSWLANGDNDNPGARCTVHSDKERSRVFVRYISDCWRNKVDL